MKTGNEQSAGGGSGPACGDGSEELSQGRKGRAGRNRGVVGLWRWSLPIHQPLTTSALPHYLCPQEFCSLARHLQQQQRASLFNRLVQLGLFEVRGGGRGDHLRV